MIRRFAALLLSRIFTITFFVILLWGTIALDFTSAGKEKRQPLRDTAIAGKSIISTGRETAHIVAEIHAVPAVPLSGLTKPDAAAKTRIMENYGRLPLFFEESGGQSDGPVKFVSYGRGYSMLLTPAEAIVMLKAAKPLPQRNAARGSEDRQHDDAKGLLAGKTSSAMLRMKFSGAAKDPKIAGMASLPGRSNYFIGNDPLKWRAEIPHYSRVKYHDLYPGIDLVFYGNQRQLEYDFVVDRGMDPGAIQLKFEGADRLEVDGQGNLIFHMPGGAQVTLRKPAMYQLIHGLRQSVEGGYVLKDKDKVGFKVAAYHTDEPLIIDPVLMYSTYLGGTYYGYGYGWDFGTTIAVDSSGNAYVAGETWSADFPTVNPRQGYNAGGYDIFISKLSADGTTLLYSTYLGGASGAYNEDNASAIALDSAGNIYIAGLTNSTDFPISDNAYQKSNAGGYDAVVTVLNAMGDTLLYSSYLGGSGTDYGMGIVVDASGSAYVTGLTNSTAFPVKNAYQEQFGGGAYDAFVAKVNPSASGEESLVFSTYLGGGGDDRGYRITIDSSADVYVTGATGSTDFPIEEAVQDTFGGGAFDAFVAKIHGADGTVIYSTFLGGGGEDRGVGIAVDASGNAYVAGRTASSDFPTTDGAFDTSCGTDGTCNDDGLLPPDHVNKFDAFVTKLNAAGNALVYSTYLGGSGDDQGIDVAVDSASHAYVIGTSGSTDFPLANFLQDTKKGDVDLFVAKVNASGSSLLYSTYLGGSAVNPGYGIPEESPQSVTVDTMGNAYLTGYTWSIDFPVTAGAYQTTNAEAYDAFILKIASPLYFDFAAPSGHGTIICTIPGDPHGSSVCTISPDTGYYLQTLTDNSADVTDLVSNGQYTISDVAEHTITATFRAYPVRRLSGPVTSYFLKVQDAYDTASSGDTLQAQSVALSETLYFDDNRLIILKGGYNSDFSSETGLTTITGGMTIRAGGATVENLILQ